MLRSIFLIRYISSGTVVNLRKHVEWPRFEWVGIQTGLPALGTVSVLFTGLTGKD